MGSDAELPPVKSKRDSRPFVGRDQGKRDPVVAFTEWMAPYLCEGDVPMVDGVLHKIRNLQTGSDKPVAVEAHQGQSGFHISDAGGRLDMATILCEAIEIIRDLADAMGLSHGCE